MVWFGPLVGTESGARPFIPDPSDRSSGHRSGFAVWTAVTAGELAYHPDLLASLHICFAVKDSETINHFSKGTVTTAVTTASFRFHRTRAGCASRHPASARLWGQEAQHIFC